MSLIGFAFLLLVWVLMLKEWVDLRITIIIFFKRMCNCVPCMSHAFSYSINSHILNAGKNVLLFSMVRQNLNLLIVGRECWRNRTFKKNVQNLYKETHCMEVSLVRECSTSNRSTLQYVEKWLGWRDSQEVKKNWNRYVLMMVWHAFHACALVSGSYVHVMQI